MIAEAEDLRQADRPMPLAINQIDDGSGTEAAYAAVSSVRLDGTPVTLTPVSVNCPVTVSIV